MVAFPLQIPVTRVESARFLRNNGIGRDKLLARLLLTAKFQNEKNCRLSFTLSGLEKAVLLPVCSTTGSL
ncbi:MAG: hypothetical protein ACOYBM_02030 [Dethiobacteria bacterium]